MEQEPQPVTQPIGQATQPIPGLPRATPYVAPPSPFPPAPAPRAAASIPAPRGPHAHPPRFWIAILILAVLATLGLASYLVATTNAWQQRAGQLERVSRDLGGQLSSARADLAAATSQLATVKTQLATAQARITALADEKAKLGDDREAKQRLVDYQSRVTAAAAQVASALDKCISGQQQYIGYLKDASAYDPTELAKFGADVTGFCQTATDANSSLQQELRK